MIIKTVSIDLTINKQPNRRYFVNKLEDKKCPLKDYFQARLTWKYLGCDSFGKYHDAYLKSDMLLLADFLINLEISVLRITIFIPHIILAHPV